MRPAYYLYYDAGAWSGLMATSVQGDHAGCRSIRPED